MSREEFCQLLSEAVDADFVLTADRHLTLATPKGERFDPIAVVALRVTGHRYMMIEWRVAAKAIGLSVQDAIAIADASDGITGPVREELERALWRMPRLVEVPVRLGPSDLDAIAHAIGMDPSGFRPTFGDIRGYVQHQLNLAIARDYREARDVPAY